MAERGAQSNPATNGGSTVSTESQHSNRSQNTASTAGLTEERFAVIYSVPWIVHGAETGQDAINIAISEVGKLVSSVGFRTLNVNISVQRIGCNHCSTGTDALLIVSETALVGLLLEVEVAASGPEAAEKVARREIGPHLHNTKLTSVGVAPAT
jgi:uncharacterized protein (UPF0212 family)